MIWTGILKRKPTEPPKEQKPFTSLSRANVSLSEKINTGGFENVTLSFSFTRDVAPDEDPAEAFKNIYEFVKAQLESTKDRDNIISIMQPTKEAKKNG